MNTVVPEEDHCAPKTAQDTRDAVEVVNSACVVESDAPQKFGGEVMEAKSANDACGKSDEESEARFIDD